MCLLKDGQLVFNPRLLRKQEFLKESTVFSYFNLKNEKREITLDKDSLCFTYCQIPVIYKLSNKNGIQVVFNDKQEEIEGLRLDEKTSKLVFERKGEINKIIVSIKK